MAEGLSPSHGDKLSYRTVHVADLPGEDLVAHFKKCFDFIAEAHGNGGEHLEPGVTGGMGIRRCGIRAQQGPCTWTRHQGAWQGR